VVDLRLGLGGRRLHRRVVHVGDRLGEPVAQMRTQVTRLAEKSATSHRSGAQRGAPLPQGRREVHSTDLGSITAQTLERRSVAHSHGHGHCGRVAPIPNLRRSARASRQHHCRGVLCPAPTRQGLTLHCNGNLQPPSAAAVSGETLSNGSASRQAGGALLLTSEPSGSDDHDLLDQAPGQQGARCRCSVLGKTDAAEPSMTDTADRACAVRLLLSLAGGAMQAEQHAEQCCCSDRRWRAADQSSKCRGQRGSRGDLRIARRAVRCSRSRTHGARLNWRRVSGQRA
jgi:hypothetical protein